MVVKITYFVHGTTTDNKEHLATGWNPGELSESGIEQSKELKNQTDLSKFDVVFCSDLKRAVDSAKISFEDFGVEIIQDERIRECNYGDLNGANSGEVVYEDHINEAFPNGEKLKDVEKRIREFLNYLLKEYDGKQVAIVAHRSPQLAIEVLLNGKTWEQAIEEDWRKKKAWQPGWEYLIEKNV